MGEPAPQEIDWPREMRDVLGGVSVLVDRIGTRDSEVAEALNRLCNVTTWVVDENARLTAEHAALTGALKETLSCVNRLVDTLNGRQRPESYNILPAGDR